MTSAISISKQPDHVWIDAAGFNTVRLPFECQPLFNRTGFVYGSELLYRGVLPKTWINIEEAVLRYLGRKEFDAPRVFVNLCNESLLTLPDADFHLAAETNRVIFELSEVFTEDHTFALVADRVNRLTSQGLRFAIDDFGAGNDGLHRLYSLNHVSHIKLDGAFLRVCQRRSDAALMLKTLIRQWKDSGVLVVAEWVETRELLDFALDIGVDFTQGWFVDAIYGAASGAATPTTAPLLSLRQG